MELELDWEIAALNGFYIKPIYSEGLKCLNMLHPDFAAKYPNAAPTFFRLENDADNWDIDWNEYQTEQAAKAAVPEYSTDLNAAFTLFDSLPDYNRFWADGLFHVEGTNGSVQIDNIGGDWGCTITLSGDKEAVYRVPAPTLALAICETWLAWKRDNPERSEK